MSTAPEKNALSLLFKNIRKYKFHLYTALIFPDKRTVLFQKNGVVVYPWIIKKVAKQG